MPKKGNNIGSMAFYAFNIRTAKQTQLQKALTCVHNNFNSENMIPIIVKKQKKKENVTGLKAQILWVKTIPRPTKGLIMSWDSQISSKQKDQPSNQFIRKTKLGIHKQI